MNWDSLILAEKELGIYNRENVSIRVKWINILRSIVAQKCPKNKMGSPLISDVDLLTASLEERSTALQKTKC